MESKKEHSNNGQAQLDYKQLADAVYYRKSTRNYADTAVDILQADGDLVKAFGLISLCPNLKTAVRVLQSHEVNNKKAKYCIGFFSEDKPFAPENIGFVGQLLDLHLQSKGVATCWWGMKKPKKEFKRDGELNCLITMMAGRGKEEQSRQYPNDFRRKKAADIVVYGDFLDDKLVEAVRLAPSAVNRQPWLIGKDGNRYNFYLKNSLSPLDLIIGDMRRIDLGIALAHLFVAAKADGYGVEFDFKGNDSGGNKFIAGVKVRK